MGSKCGLNLAFCSLNFVSSSISFHNTPLVRFSAYGSIRDTNVTPRACTTIVKINLSPLLTDIQPITQNA